MAYDYEYITNYTAKNYTPASQVPAVFGLPPGKRWITVHHWGAMESGYRPARFYEIARYLASANARMVSAHYVVERGKIACLINPADASWANGHAQGNAQSISIECNPLCSKEDQETLAQLVAELRATYGELVLVPHAYWTPTECPGRYDVFEIDRLALAIENGAKPAAGPVTPIEEKDWFDMANEKDLERVVERVVKSYVGDVVEVPGNVLGKGTNKKWMVKNMLTSVWRYARDARDDARKALAIVEKIAEQTGLSKAEIAAIVEKSAEEGARTGAAEALEDGVDVNVSVQGKEQA